jgi:hypothetical protein
MPRHDNRLPLTMENHPKEDPRLTLFNPPRFETRREVVNSELNKGIIHMELNHKITETDVEFRDAGSDPPTRSMTTRNVDLKEVFQEGRKIFLRPIIDGL